MAAAQTTLTISLDRRNSRAAFRPGDPVSGFCHVHLGHDVHQVQTIEFHFSGWSEARFKDREEYKTIFFQQRQHLDFTANVTNSQTSWPFHFIFPSFGKSALQNTGITAGPTAFESELTPLPPSIYPPAEPSEIDNPFTDGSIHITYELHVHLMGAHGILWREKRMPLHFVPYPWHPPDQYEFHQYTSPFSVRSFKLKSNSEGWALKRTVGGMVFIRPVFRFKVHIIMPTHIHATEPLPIMLNIEYEGGASRNSVPPIYLLGMSYAYTEHVHINRISRQGRVEAVALGREEIGPTFRSRVIFTPAVLLDQKNDLRNFYPYSNIKDSIESMVDGLSFETTNIRRYYSNLKLQVYLRCMGKELNVFAPGDTAHYFTIHPSSSVPEPPLKELPAFPPGPTELDDPSQIYEAPNRRTGHWQSLPNIKMPTPELFREDILVDTARFK